MWLNGWRRLWIACSVPWVLVTAFRFALEVEAHNSTYERLGYEVTSTYYWITGTAYGLKALVPIVLAYVSGATVAWIRRGFRESKSAASLTEPPKDATPR